MYNYEYFIGSEFVLDSQKVIELANFYSSHYGKWSIETSRNGHNIVLSPNRIKEWLEKESSELYTVKDGDQLIGYAITAKGTTNNIEEKIIWVTQFVVHTDFRNMGIGKELLFYIWGVSSYFSWGLLTANPYAIRALEKATHRRCDPAIIKDHSNKLLDFGKQHVSYINSKTELIIDENNSKINTNFFVDHSELDKMLENSVYENKPWKLGDLKEGWEWFAFTFHDQKQIELTKDEIEKMLSTSDRIVHEAYGRMQMDLESQTWSKGTENEIKYIISNCYLEQTSKIIDIGCGTGRHSIRLTELGYSVVGIDSVDSLINLAKNKANLKNLEIKFIVADVLDDNLPLFKTQYDCALCLYDVIGSYADDSKNYSIIKNIYKLLKKGGYAIISVMNYHLTEFAAKNKFILKESSSKLLELPASNTMETTGNVFKPEYYLIDTETRITYRKEIFSFKKSFPKELIVRDRRYYSDEIMELFQAAGFKIINQRFVNVGWQKDFCKTDNGAKEILLICKKE